MRALSGQVNGCPVTVISLNEEEDECSMCGGLGFHRHAVPWYCGPVLEGQSEGGYKTVCEPCHDRWTAWTETVSRAA